MTFCNYHPVVYVFKIKDVIKTFLGLYVFYIFQPHVCYGFGLTEHNNNSSHTGCLTLTFLPISDTPILSKQFLEKLG